MIIASIQFVSQLLCRSGPDNKTLTHLGLEEKKVTTSLVTTPGTVARDWVGSSATGNLTAAPHAYHVSSISLKDNHNDSLLERAGAGHCGVPCH